MNSCSHSGISKEDGVTRSLVFGFLAGSRTGFHRSRSSALSLSTDTGIGVEPELSCGNDVGVADELEKEGAVDRPKTTIRT